MEIDVKINQQKIFQKYEISIDSILNENENIYNKWMRMNEN